MADKEHSVPPNNVDESQKSKEASLRSGADIEAEHTRQHNVQIEIEAAEALSKSEDRYTLIAQHLIDTDCLDDFDWEHPAIPDGLVARLAGYEAEKRITRPDYDLTSKPDIIVKKLALRQWDLLQDESAKAASDTQKSSYTEFLQSLTGTTVEKLNAIAAKTDQFPEEAAYVAAFLDLQLLAQTPKDSELLTAKINTLDLSGGIPDPVLFIQSTILNDPNLSESSKEAIAVHFNIPRFKTVTGSQVDRAMDALTKTGELLHTRENPLSIRDGLSAYNRPDGSRVARVTVDGIGTREIPWQRNEKGETIGLKLSMLKIYAICEAKGQTSFLGESVTVDTFVTGQTDPEKLSKVQHVMEALLGGNAGFNGEIITEEQASFMGWFSQYVSTKGEASEGDYDKITAVKNRTDLGFHPDGDASKLDYDILSAAGSFASGQYGSGAPDYYALQNHLHAVFPGRVTLARLSQS